MSFPLYGATGNLFNVLGTMGYSITNINSAQTTLQNTLINTTNGVTTQLAAEPDLAAQVGNSWISLLTSLESSCSLMKQLAPQVINRLVYNYQPQLNQSLSSQNLIASISFILQQMAAQNQTILQMTVTGTPGDITGTGTGVMNISLKRPFDGRFLENAYQEVLTFTCIADSYTGGATAFNEQFAVTGEGAEPDLFAFDWPLGSNGNISINAIDGDTSQGSGNLLNNSGFDTWVSNLPSRWTINVNNSSISQNSSIVYSVGSSMEWTGDGSTLTNISQLFNSGTGNTSTLSPQNQYSVNLFLRTGGAAPATGVLQVDLVNGNGSVINDQAGNPNSFTVNLTGLNTTWMPFTGFFRTPVIMPSTYAIRYHLTTALDSGKVVYFDKTSMGLSQQVYSQGPFVALHSGNIPFVASPVADYGTCQVTNSRGAGGTLSTWQTVLFRLLSSQLPYELIWPSSLSPTVSDGLITA